MKSIFSLFFTEKEDGLLLIPKFPSFLVLFNKVIYAHTSYRRQSQFVRYSGEATTCDFVQGNLYSIKDVFNK